MGREPGTGNRERVELQSRREFIAVGTGALAAAVLPSRSFGSRFPVPGSPSTASRLKQSVARWTYGKLALPELARAAKGIGLAGIDLLQPDEWDVVLAVIAVLVATIVTSPKRATVRR